MPMTRRSFCATAAACVLARPALAAPQPVPFDQTWRSLTFRRLAETMYRPAGSTLGIVAQESSSVFYRALPEGAQTLSRAAWSWSVNSSVPPTDLSQKGGDDRNIALYFVFMDADDAARVSPDTSLTRLMGNRAARIVIYVWGGAHRAGATIPSPYLRGRGSTVVLRPAGTGSHRERVDLFSDHARIFGARPERVVGVAVSSDSDDTGSLVEAHLSDLVLS